MQEGAARVPWQPPHRQERTAYIRLGVQALDIAALRRSLPGIPGVTSVSKYEFWVNFGEIYPSCQLAHRGGSLCNRASADLYKEQTLSIDTRPTNHTLSSALVNRSRRYFVRSCRRTKTMQVCTAVLSPNTIMLYYW